MADEETTQDIGFTTGGRQIELRVGNERDPRCLSSDFGPRVGFR